MAITEDKIQTPQRWTPITEEMMMAAREIGIKLEYVGGIPVWEAMPGIKHQKAVDRIRASLMRAPGTDGGCACIHYYDLSLLFPDGSQKRPDISIFCREPEEEDEEVTMLPEAVIEVVSKRYEKKDFEIGVPFYRRMGVKDTVVFDPRTGMVTHYTPDGETEYLSPVELTFACGCRCTV
jgi:Uma2 family endonuclease